MPQATIRSYSRNRRPIYRYPYEDNNGLASEKYPGKITFTALRRTIDTPPLPTPSRPDVFGDIESISQEIKKITPKVRRLETVELALPPGINFADEMQYENAELNAANFAVKGAAQAFTQANGGIGQKLRTALQAVQGSASEEFGAGRADAGELAAAAGTVDGSGVDRIGQQGNEVSSDELLDVGCRLQLHQTRELAVSTDGLGAHRDGADRASRDRCWWSPEHFGYNWDMRR